MSTSLGRDVFDACHLTGSFTLRSGQVSDEYFDKYLFEGNPVLLRRVAEVMVELLPACAVLAGMEMGGIPIVTVLSQLTGIPAVFVRKEAKTYGTCKVGRGRSGCWAPCRRCRRRRHDWRRSHQRLSGTTRGRCRPRHGRLRHRPRAGRVEEPPRTWHPSSPGTTPRRSRAFLTNSVRAVLPSGSPLPSLRAWR